MSNINDLISIAVRPGGNTPYFPALISDEAMTSDQMLRLVGVRFEFAHLRVNADNFTYGFWSKKDQDNAKFHLFTEQQNNNRIDEFTDEVRNYYVKIIGALDEYYQLDISLHNKEETIHLYKVLCDYYRQLCCYAYVANIMDIADDLREELKTYATNEKNIETYLLELTRNPKAPPPQHN